MNNDRGHEALVSTGEDNSTGSSDNAKYWYYIAWRKLLERNLFRCASCEKSFKNGVYTVLKVGNVCKDCLLEHGWKGERQEIFDLILENVPVISCSNASKGCQELLLPEDLDGHLDYCKFRQVTCVSQGCTWKGKQDEMVNHFEKQHEVDIIQGVTFNFNLEIAEESFVVSKLLIKSKLRYLLVVERKRGADKIGYRMYAIDEADPRRVSVGHISNNQHFDVEINTKLLNMIDKECKVTELDLKTLEATLGQKNSYLIVVQVPMNKAEQVLQILECPSCLQTMKPPIYLCTGGHSVCSPCTSKSSVCMKCMGNINEKSRVKALEALTTDLFYSCVNQSTGCYDMILGCDVEKHESKCIHTTYACPLDKCTFKSNYDCFKEHVKDEHENVLQANEHFYHFKLGIPFDQKVHMCVNGCLFSVSFNSCSDNCSNVAYKVSLLTKNPLSNFYCNIAILNSVGDQREMSFTDSLTKNKTSVSFILYKVYHFYTYFQGLTDLIFCVKIYKS